MWKPPLPSSLALTPLAPRSPISEPRAAGGRTTADQSVAGPQVASTHFPGSLLVTGDLNAEEDLVIDGILSGAIDMPAHALTIGPEARVDARVFARDVTVYGTLSGKITATEIVDIREGARISGELAAPAVLLAEGAHVNGRIETKRVDAAVHVARYRMARNTR
jgi:cytoskeletal protein CcmA (bactofilin family)